MNSVRFVLQGKGGVGKSLVAVLIAQFLKEKSSKQFKQQAPAAGIQSNSINKD